MSVTIRVTDATYKRLVQIQRGIRDQKGERHMLLDITEKIVLNARVDALYGIEADAERIDPLEPIT